jgi:hypothetical protein
MVYQPRYTRQLYRRIDLLLGLTLTKKFVEMHGVPGPEAATATARRDLRGIIARSAYFPFPGSTKSNEMTLTR